MTGTEKDVANQDTSNDLVDFENELNQVRNASSDSDRRRHTRYSFKAIQVAASVNRDSVPPAEAFQAIQCHDISVGGISFFAHEPPECENLVFVIKNTAGSLILSARVTNSRMGYWNHQQLYLIGCEFTARLGESAK